MGESPTCLVRSFSQPAGTTSTEPEEGDPYCALTTSILFRRFMLESLACEKWSCFSNNQYLEEAKKSSKPGLVAQRKAYFEALYKRNGAKKPAALLEEQNAARNEPNVMEETSRDSSNPPRIPTRPSANRLSVHSSIAPQEERRRSKPVDDCSVSRRRIADGKSHGIDHLKTSGVSGPKARPPTVHSSFSLRCEERAAKRKEFFQKLEEKTNAKILVSGWRIADGKSHGINLSEAPDFAVGPSSNLDAVTRHDRRSRKCTISDMLNLIPSLQCLELQSGFSKRKEIMDSGFSRQISPQALISSKMIGKTEGYSYASLLVEANKGNAPSSIYDSIKKLVADIQRLSNARMFALGMRKLLGRVEFALALQKAGCFLVVLKCVLAPVAAAAAAATSAFRIPTIGVTLEDPHTEDLSQEFHLKTSGVSGPKARPPTVPSSVRLRCEERAAKRKEFFQKLEEKTNAKEADIVYLQAKNKISLTQPMQVKMKLVNLGHAQSEETRMKIGNGVQMGWERHREKLKLQETCYFEWQNLIAEASRKGFVGEEEKQWDSYKILDEQLQQEWLECVEQRRKMARPKGSKRAPKSPEQRRKISKAISAKRADPVRAYVAFSAENAYRDRVCTALYKYHSTPVGAKRMPKRRPSSERQPRTQNPTKKKANDTDNSTGNVTESQKRRTRLRSNMPLFKDPLAISKVEMIKNIRAERAAAENKKTEAIERAKLLIAEGEKAAKALEAAATKSPPAQASLIETRNLIAKAIQSIEIGQIVSCNALKIITLNPSDKTCIYI
ncbi:unnamed protein product [Camellia sinensis]